MPEQGRVWELGSYLRGAVLVLCPCWVAAGVPTVLVKSRSVQQDSPLQNLRSD